VTPYERLRTSMVLRIAWSKVRTSGLSSESSQTKQDTRRFEKDWPSGLAKIQRRLQRNEFVFDGEKGVPLSKGPSKSGLRPIVLAPIENRIVRRAILEVLQGYGAADDPPRRRWNGFPQVLAVMNTRTSIGGIPERGVPHGLALIDQAVASGCHWFVRSDIKNFFTKIPKAVVSAFVREAVSDSQFADFFDKALATNLENQLELEERNVFKLFPDPEIGVAQGSALSALAGNIALQEFDSMMNGRGIVCVRYIDDFILLGTSEAKVLAAYASARAFLARMGMDVYELTDDDAARKGKVHSGNIYRGTDVLGYKVSGSSRQPSEASCDKLLKKLDQVVAKAEHEMHAATIALPAVRSLRYCQAGVALNEIVWGWSQAFKYTTAQQAFRRMDSEIDKRLAAMSSVARQMGDNCSSAVKRRVAGVHLLADTPLASLEALLDGDEIADTTRVSSVTSKGRGVGISLVPQ
jgi:RNA-directed DNA polymerase